MLEPNGCVKINHVKLSLVNIDYDQLNDRRCFEKIVLAKGRYVRAGLKIEHLLT